MDHETPVGRVIERRRAFFAVRERREVVLRVRKRVQLRRAAGEDERKCKQQPEQHALAHARIIRAPQEGPPPGPCPVPARYFAPARHCSSPAMNRSFGSFLPMNTSSDDFLSPFAQGLPTSPPIIMCTPWNTTRLALPFIHSTPL